MSAYDEFCACGDYACRECFGGDETQKGNAWLDQELVKAYPNRWISKWAKERLAKYMPQEEAL